MSRHKDFDAFFAEKRQTQKREPITFDLVGKTYELPGNLPAEVGLLAMSIYRKEGAEADLPPEGVQQFLEAMLGPAQYAWLMGAGLDIEEALDLFTWILEQYKDSLSIGEQPGNPPAPAQPGEPTTSTSSPTGV
jgi:hypothetical protein